MTHELRDVSDGLWVWRTEHPDWRPGLGWERLVTSTFVESRGEALVLDALAPPPDAGDVWARLDARPPTVVVVLKPDHVRDVDLFVRRYGAQRSAPRSSGVTTSRRSSSSGSSPVASFPEASSPCTTAAAAPRRRSGSRSNAPSSSPMR